MHKIISAVILVILLPNIVQGESGPEKFIFIANLTPQQTITVESVKDLFLGKRKLWPDGNAVKVAIPGEKYPFAKVIARSIYNTSINGMKKFWLSLVFQGRVKSPTLLKSAEEIIQYVAEHQGAIGVVPAKTKNIPPELILRIKKK